MGQKYYCYLRGLFPERLRILLPESTLLGPEVVLVLGHVELWSFLAVFLAVPLVSLILC